MTRNILRIAAAVLALAAPALAEGDRTAEEILKDLKAIQNPDRPKDPNDRAAVNEYVEAVKKAVDRRVELVGELYKADPKNPELKQLLPLRWMALSSNPAKAKEVAAEIDEVVAKAEDQGIKAEALLAKVQIHLRGGAAKPEELQAAVDAFAAAASKEDPRVPQLLYFVVRSTDDEGLKKKLEDRILADHAKSPVAEYIKGDRRKREAIGKPFELAFTDAIGGGEVSIEGLKGKVVVIDFWATWCGPCVAEMPRMKGLYKQYKDKGVEFIGISLDSPKEEGGLDKLKEYVKENEIAWPQYYQGKGWESEFSSSWGITAIPAMFIVDREGNLASVEAREKLEELIPEYLAKKAKGPEGEKAKELE